MKRVIKIGGRAQGSTDLPGRLGSAWSASPGSFCVVHGGGDKISEIQRRAGLEPSFVDGRRITTRQDMELVRMVLSGLVNKELVSCLFAAGLPAVGISGEDAGTITAAPIDPAGFGRAGKPVAVRSNLIDNLLSAGYLPVISPVAVEEGASSEALNVNGDDAAAAIAIALSASELLFVADVTGVLDDSGLEAGFAALTGGVGRVRISTLEGLTDTTAGTLMTFAPSLIP